MTRRRLLGGVLVVLTLAATLPAYGQVFVDDGWRAPALFSGAGATLVVLALVALRRGLLVTGVASLLAMAMLLPWLVGIATTPVLPTLTTLRELWSVLAEGLEELATAPAPTLTTDGLVLLVVGGWWLVAHVAAEAVVRIRRPGAGLVALAVLWVAPLLVPLAGGRTMATAVPFLAAATLLLLLVRPGDDPLPARRTTMGTLVGASLGAGAIAVAALVPGTLPGYHAAPWIDLATGNSPRGYQPIVDISERLRIPVDRDVLRVRSTQLTYLRLAGLDTFDGATWRIGPPGVATYRPDPSRLYAASDVLPPEAPAARTEQLYVEVDVLGLENIYVPVPYQPLEVLGRDRDDMLWSTEGGFLALWDTEDAAPGRSRAGIRPGSEYRVHAARPAPSYDDLIDADDPTIDVSHYTQLPRDYDRLRELAEEIYAGAGATTTVDRALALQSWFTGPEGGFTYDLDVPALRGDRALTDFVLEDRVGYCEYFATAMAVMLRATGIPARVAVGFLPGRITGARDADTGLTEFTVSTADAHAWVEVLFPGHGWVTFEPTPRADGTQIVPTAGDLAPTESLRQRRLREGLELADLFDWDDEDDFLPFDPSLFEGLGERDAVESRSRVARAAPWLGGVVLLGAAGAAGVLAIRRRRIEQVPDTPAEQVLAAQRELLRVTARLGLPRHPHETIRESVARWADELRVPPPDDTVLDHIQAAAFGGAVDDDACAEVMAWVGQACTMLREDAERHERLLAPVRVPAAAAAAQARKGATLVRERVLELTGSSAGSDNGRRD